MISINYRSDIKGKSGLKHIFRKANLPCEKLMHTTDTVYEQYFLPTTIFSTNP